MTVANERISHCRTRRKGWWGAWGVFGGAANISKFSLNCGQWLRDNNGRRS